MLVYENNKKEFIKTINNLSGKYSAYDIFYDFITMYACSLQNAVRYSEKREEEYKQVVSKYTPKGVENLVSLGINVINALTDRFGDFLGECFEALNLNDKKGKGQCFTPYHVGHMMAKTTFNKDMMEEQLKEKPYITVYDGCVGGGCLLISAMDVIKELGYNFQTQSFVVASDLDPRCVRMAYIQLALIGTPAIILCGDTLKMEYWEEWHTPMYVMNYHIFGKNPPELAENTTLAKIATVEKTEQLTLL